MLFCTIHKLTHIILSRERSQNQKINKIKKSVSDQSRYFHIKSIGHLNACRHPSMIIMCSKNRNMYTVAYRIILSNLTMQFGYNLELNLMFKNIVIIITFSLFCPIPIWGVLKTHLTMMIHTVSYWWHCTMIIITKIACFSPHLRYENETEFVYN